MPMKDENGKLKANIFFVAYTKDGATARRPDHLHLQRRSGLFVRLAASGRRRAQARAHDRRRPVAAAAVSPRGQRLHLARLHRPRLHRSGDDRLQPPGGRREAGAVPRRRRGRPVGRRLHPPVHDALHALGVAEIPGGRKLRHDARRRPLRVPPEPVRHVAERHRRSSRAS